MKSTLTSPLFQLSGRNKDKVAHLRLSVNIISHHNLFSLVILRNMAGCLRSRYSTFFAWFGRISIELFISQVGSIQSSSSPRLDPRRALHLPGRISIELFISQVGLEKNFSSLKELDQHRAKIMKPKSFLILVVLLYILKHIKIIFKFLKRINLIKSKFLIIHIDDMFKMCLVSHLVECGLPRSSSPNSKLPRPQHPPHLLHLCLRLSRDSSNHSSTHSLLCASRQHSGSYIKHKSVKLKYGIYFTHVENA